VLGTQHPHLTLIHAPAFALRATAGMLASEATKATVSLRSLGRQAVDPRSLRRQTVDPRSLPRQTVDCA
jgi:hypothetical protein